MADKDLIRRGNTSIEVYRSLDAAPEDWDAARFWLINELRRIQTGFFSVDDVLSKIDFSNNDDVEIVQGPVGPQGPQGPKGDTGDVGPQGPAGESIDASDLIADYHVAIDTTWSSQKISNEIASLVSFADAPEDGNIYGRRDGAWTQVQVDTDFFINGGNASSLYLNPFDGGTSTSTPAVVTIEQGTLTYA